MGVILVYGREHFDPQREVTLPAAFESSIYLPKKFFFTQAVGSTFQQIPPCYLLLFWMLNRT